LDSSLTTQPKGNSQFTWWITLFSAWMLIGLYLDGWAHRHIRNLETFFTPWHAVLYSGFFLNAGFLVIAFLRNIKKGFSWNNALPPGYGLSLIGVLIFAGGGFGDLIWHAVFGFEADLDLLISPSHLVLALGGMLIGSGPFRSFFREGEKPQSDDFILFLPMLFSVAFGWSVITFMTQFAHPIVHPWPAGPIPQGTFFPQALGLVSIFLQTGIMMGFILLVIRNCILPFWSFTLMITINTALMSTLVGYYPLIGIAIFTGIISDLLYHHWKPSLDHPVNFRYFASAVPVIFYSLYFLILYLGKGIWWTVHMWTGTILVAGITGWLMSYLLIPPMAMKKEKEN